MGTILPLPQLGLGSHCGSAIREMCGLGQVTKAFHAIVSSSVNKVPIIISILQCFCEVLTKY